MQLMQYVYRWRAHLLTLQPLHTYLLFFAVPGQSLHRFSGLKCELWSSATSLSGACAACGGWLGRSNAERMRATSSQERVGRVSQCCAQGRMSSMANSMRNVRLRSEGLPADVQLALWTIHEFMPPAFNMP
ncbi:hypothetical protein Pmani_001720 [Petrolisthes manimaculis]|uniref:Uncharacterized protein n=1 Tax=Petrolisthes manimaculis TaxID=1843537 RepID=A0AAE1QMG8_9EUCA|nr:hypothetical protein Pmani_001720 [Petrolisthes manimaculis]